MAESLSLAVADQFAGSRFEGSQFGSRLCAGADAVLAAVAVPEWQTAAGNSRSRGDLVAELDKWQIAARSEYAAKVQDLSPDTQVKVLTELYVIALVFEGVNEYERLGRCRAVVGLLCERGHRLNFDEERLFRRVLASIRQAPERLTTLEATVLTPKTPAPET